MRFMKLLFLLYGKYWVYSDNLPFAIKVFFLTITKFLSIIKLVYF